MDSDIILIYTHVTWLNIVALQSSNEDYGVDFISIAELVQV